MFSNSKNVGAERRLKDLGIELPHAPSPLGAYVEAIQTGSLLFLSGMLPIENGSPRFLGRIGGELSIEDGRRATDLAVMNALAVAKERLGSLDRVTHVLRLGVSLVTTPDFREHPKVADAASELLINVFGADKTSTRLVVGVASLPAGVCVLLELILEVGPESRGSRSRLQGGPEPAPPDEMGRGSRRGHQRQRHDQDRPAEGE
jgi:enamine deaminase RidA (YjgF/YER057c/UK114 family)